MADRNVMEVALFRTQGSLCPKRPWSVLCHHKYALVVPFPLAFIGEYHKKFVNTRQLEYNVEDITEHKPRKV